MKRPSLTIGVEEEYQIIDPATRELQSYITQILEDERLVIGQVKPELHQSIVEVGTTVCHTPQDVRASSITLRRSSMSWAAARDSGSRPRERIHSHTGPTRKSRRSSATSALVRQWDNWRSSS